MFGRFFERLRRGWRLAKMAFGVLWDDKRLLWFPFISFLCLLLVLATFLLPLLASQDFRNLMNQGNGQNFKNATSNILYYAVLFAFYVCSYFVIIFFNSALVACVILRFNGEDATPDDGLRAAFSRLPQIFMWALVSATVGLVLKIISDRSEKLGKIVADLLGTAWGIMTYFVVPVLVVEKTGPFKAIKRSCSVLRKTWGESFAADFGIGFILFLLLLVCFIPAIVGGLLGWPAVLIGTVISLVLVFLLCLVSSAVHVIIVAALYQYAAMKQTPSEYFKEGTLRNAFRAT
jgi:hypothetical protein